MVYSNNKIKFDASQCIGCQQCYQACFVDVIRWDAEAKKPVFKYVEDCEHCNYCEIVCPKKCIEVVPDFSKERVYQTFDKYR